MENYDFGGWATKANIRCADGRTIMPDAFKDNDGMTVPLVWGHKHEQPDRVLGHALLENRPEGVYSYCTFNDTENGKTAKMLVEHGDVNALSIYANDLKQNLDRVIHGAIREVSLVLAGANPGAFIDSVIKHGIEYEDEAYIYSGDDELYVVSHAAIDDEKKEVPKMAENEEKKSDKTLKEVFDTLNEEQKDLLYAMVGMAAENAGDNSKEDEEGGKDMKHNLFDQDETTEAVLSHDAMTAILADGKRYGSLKDSFLEHAADYGIDNLEYLLPDAKNYTTTPEFIKRETDWVQKVINGTHHSPLSRIKTMFADITEDEARAKGYIKGKLKKEEVFSLLKRTTVPTTVYKKQKMDRDDIVDITDFDVLAWLKSEMRMMLDEEIARAIIIGDGRLASDDDKIKEDCIRPIVNDADLFTIRWSVAAGASSDEKAKNFIKAAIKSRKNYKGSGSPVLFTTEDMLTDMLLLEDQIGHKLYKTEAELATALRVREIITVPVMEGYTDKDSKTVYGIIVNLSDYNVGADKGGSINMFEDFDIDYNQQKYLIETRCSGALIKPFSAIVLRSGTNTESEEPTLKDAIAGIAG